MQCTFTTHSGAATLRALSIGQPQREATRAPSTAGPCRSSAPSPQRPGWAPDGRRARKAGVREPGAPRSEAGGARACGEPAELLQTLLTPALTCLAPRGALGPSLAQSNIFSSFQQTERGEHREGRGEVAASVERAGPAVSQRSCWGPQQCTTAKPWSEKPVWTGQDSRYTHDSITITHRLRQYSPLPFNLL